MLGHTMSVRFCVSKGALGGSCGCARGLDRYLDTSIPRYLAVMPVRVAEPMPPANFIAYGAIASRSSHAQKSRITGTSACCRGTTHQ